MENSYPDTVGAPRAKLLTTTYYTVSVCPASGFKLSDVMLARKIVGKHLKLTPLIYSRTLSSLTGAEIYLKLENLQPTKAFKVRGGIYYMSRKAVEAGGKSVVTASTGNHAQSIAYAGSLFGVDVKVVMPEGVPRLKLETTRSLGAEVIIHGSYYDEANDYAMKLAAERDYLYIHSINEPLLYPGVATMHLEVVEELPDVDVVINPIGGGSGVSGAVVVYKAVNPAIRVIGVQASGAPAFYTSWKSEEITTTHGVNTEAEGLATARAYEYPLSIVRGRLDSVVLVEDREMRDAIRLLFECEGQVTELAGAASTAAAIKMKNELEGKKVALIVSGGNISEEKLKRVVCGGE